MNRSERTIYKYLNHLGIGTVVYEPDGNVPPDFLVDRRIAVEARRLNQHEKAVEPTRSLEVTAIPLHRAIVKALSQSGPPHGSQSWYVFHTVRRPLPPWKVVVRSLRDIVQQFRGQLDDPPKELRIGQSIRLRFYAAGREYDKLLVPGGSSDHDAGGFVVAELLRNMKICVAEKSRKIAAFRPKYPEWWLALDDQIAYGSLTTDEVKLLRKALGDVPAFAKVVLVDPSDPTLALDVLAPTRSTKGG